MLQTSELSKHLLLLRCSHFSGTWLLHTVLIKGLVDFSNTALHFGLVLDDHRVARIVVHLRLVFSRF